MFHKSNYGVLYAKIQTRYNPRNFFQIFKVFNQYQLHNSNNYTLQESQEKYILYSTNIHRLSVITLQYSNLQND